MSRATLSVFILTLDVAAIAGNALVILAFVLNRKLRKPSGCYVTNLAAADLCMSLVGIPFYVVTVIQDRWPLGDYVCAVWTGVERVCSLVSNFAIVAICFDRYWLVTCSSDYLAKHSVRSARLRIAAIWASAVVLRVPFVMFGMLHTWGTLQPKSVCDPHSAYDVPFQVGLYQYDIAYTLIATVMEFAIPLALITLWGVRVYVYLEKREKQKLIKAVERSRAMSLDFTFPQQFYNEERRGSSQSKVSFWCRYFSSPEGVAAATAGAAGAAGMASKLCPNGLSQSRNAIAGPLLGSGSGSEPEFCCRASQSQTGSDTNWNSIDNCDGASKVNIVLDPGSGGDSGACLADDGSSNHSGKDRFSQAANKYIVKAAQYVRDKSNLNTIGRKSVSLNTLEQPNCDSLKPLVDKPQGFPTSKSTPSIVLTSPCEHTDHWQVVGVRRGMAQMQVSFSLEEYDDAAAKPAECEECISSRDSSSAYPEVDKDDRVELGEKQQQQRHPQQSQQETSYPDGGKGSRRDCLSVSDKGQYYPHVARSNTARRRSREGSSASTSDFLDVPPRNHFRSQPAAATTGSGSASDVASTTTTATASGCTAPPRRRDLYNDGVDRGVLTAVLRIATEADPEAEAVTEAEAEVANGRPDETYNSSLSSCVSDLPDSASSIVTVSEPPSPSMRRASTLEQEAVQRVLNSRARRRYRSYRRRALMTILLMVVVFVVFQLPYVLATCIYSLCGTADCVSDTVYETANWWYWAKVLLNPFLYAYISPEFRRYSIGILTCKHANRHKRRLVL